MTERTKPKDPLDHEPEAVTWAREQAGLTRAQVAAMLGVSAGLISEIEKGTRNAPPARIKQLAEALNCPRVVLERKRHAAVSGKGAVAA
jgi:transcriptional regulator with XRE-family HTH domain